MTTAWAHLPNAALIDEVLASVRAHPGKWNAARHATWVVSQGALWYTAWDAVQNAVRNAARDAARNEAWNAAWTVAQNAAQNMVWDTAWTTIATLIAYDDAGQFMKMPVEHLQRLHRIDPHPMYWLLQPAAVVFAKD